MIGRKIIFKEVLPSTNNYVANLIAEQKIEHGTVILAGEQTSGKGQRGAVWDSEPHKNIILSTFIQPDNLTVNHQFQLNQIISLACVSFLNTITSGFLIKWPNDIVYSNKKVGGILIENQLDKLHIKNSIIGIGININQLDFGTYNATSLTAITSRNFKLQELVFKLIEELNYWYTKLQTYQFDSISESYLQNLWLHNTETTFEDADGKFIGKIKGVDPSGQLLVDRNGELKSFQNKTITFLERNNQE